MCSDCFPFKFFKNIFFNMCLSYNFFSFQIMREFKESFTRGARGQITSWSEIYEVKVTLCIDQILNLPHSCIGYLTDIEYLLGFLFQFKPQVYRG